MKKFKIYANEVHVSEWDEDSRTNKIAILNQVGRRSTRVARESDGSRAPGTLLDYSGVIAERMKSSNRETAYRLRELVKTNIDKFNTFTTLTFSSPVNDYATAYSFFRDWKDYAVKKGVIKHFLGTWELTKKGRVHFHLLLDVSPDWPFDNLGWRHGYVLNKPLASLPDGSKNTAIASYLTKYLVKGFDENEKYVRKILRSRSLEKPRIVIQDMENFDIDIEFKTCYYDFVNEKNVNIFERKN